VLPPSGAFTHLTAAAEYGLWLPPLPPNLPIFASMSRDETRPHRAGLRIVRLVSPPDVLLLDGVPLTFPAEAILACAVHLRLLDLVVLCDAALHLGLCTLAELEAAAALQRRGAPMLRRALRYVDARSESAWETLLRMLHVVCRVPVEPQAIITAPDGSFGARGDLLSQGTRALHEYDGEDPQVACAVGRLPVHAERDPAVPGSTGAARLCEHDAPSGSDQGRRARGLGNG